MPAAPNVQSPAKLLNRHTPPHIITIFFLACMAALPMHIILPSLPSITEHFKADYGFIQLAVALYLAANAILRLFIGPLSDRFGRRPVLLWSIGLFALATVGCLLAPTAEVFLACRVMQAIIASALVLYRATIRDLYSQDQAASIIGYITMCTALILILAPALGGTLDLWFGWQAPFVVLLICSLILLALVWLDFSETATNTCTPLTQQIREYPILLRSVRFWGYALTSALTTGAFFSYMGGAPFLSTEVYLISPETLGIWMATPGLGYFLGNYMTGRYAMRFGVNTLILCGASVAATGACAALLVSLSGYSSPVSFFSAMILVGFGNGLVLPNAAAGMLSVRPKLAGTAAGLGSSLLIAVGAALSAYGGKIVEDTTSDLRLIALMTISSTLSVLCILFVRQRDRRLTTA